MGEHLLQATGLSKTFTSGRGDRRRTVHAVQSVDLTVDAGETHGLVGESGSGKSTTGRILLRLIEPDAGSATFRGQDLFALSGSALRQMRRHLQLIYQDPFSSVDPRFRARDIVAEPWVIHRLYDKVERRRRADELLERVGIDPTLGDRRPSSFSGGQLQRIGIARALALEPSLIVCDEPVSALDVSVQGQILNLLMDLRSERGLSYLFIAHDLAVVRHISDRVSVMYAGRIVETGTRKEVFEHAGHPYTQALLTAVESVTPPPVTEREAADPSVGCAFRTRCPIATERCAGQIPELIERGTGHPVACFFPDQGRPASSLAGPAGRGR
jgi:oligopeptide/dipeptide ABC transporter ATP-binding protein